MVLIKPKIYYIIIFTDIIIAYVIAIIVPIAEIDSVLSNIHSKNVPILNNNSLNNNIEIACIFK